MAESRTWPSNWLVKMGWIVPYAAVFAIVGFGTTLFWVRCAKPLGLDFETTKRFQTLRNPHFYSIMTLVSSLGYAPANHLSMVSAVSLLWLLGRKVESLFTLLSAGAMAMVVFVKLLVGRPRPSGDRIRVAVRLPDYGFPSGHTAHYVSFFGFLAYLVATRLRESGLRQVLLALLSLLIALVGPSRIYLGQHWLSDVLAAYLFGFAYLIGLVETYERVESPKPH